MRLVALFILLAAAAAQERHIPTRMAAPATTSSRPQRFAGKYIVRFDEHALRSSRRTAIEAASAILGGSGRWTHARTHSHHHMASYVVLHGLSDAAVALLRSSPEVVGVEQDSLLHIAAVKVAPLDSTSAQKRLRGGRRLGSFDAWNGANDRVDQRSAPLDGIYSYTSDGTGVDIYVMDSGINAAHQEFDIRVVTSLAANFDTTSTSSPAWADCNGHGTFVASQAAGNFVGIASGARIIPVRVFDCSGFTSVSALVSAVDYILTTANSTGRRSVINFSGGGGISSTVDSLPGRAWAGGMVWVDAAGNEAVSACTKSPARAGPGLTVGAVDASDVWAPFSNFGACVNISAVGVSNIGAWPSDIYAYAQGDGTSFSSPIVAGVAAAVWSGLPAGSTHAQAAQLVLDSATAGTITGLPVGTTNKMAFNGGSVGLALPSPSGSGTPAASASAASTGTGTPSRSAAATTSITPSGTPPVTSTPTPTVSMSVSGSVTSSVSATGTPAATPSTSAAATPSGTPAATTSGTPAVTSSPAASGTPTPTRSSASASPSRVSVTATASRSASRTRSASKKKAALRQM